MSSNFITLTETELATRLRNTEDPFVERKTEGDFKDVLKTAVAFANTLPDGIPGVLFIPATDSATIQTGVNLDRLQKKISAVIAEAYPPIKYFQRVISIANAEVIAVQIWGSPDRPHFSGPSYIRDGSQTIKASEAQFAQLIARRSSKIEELSKWVGKKVMAHLLASGLGSRFENQLPATLEACNQWYVTLKYDVQSSSGTFERQSITIDRITISFDYKHSCLALEIAR